MNPHLRAALCALIALATACAGADDPRPLVAVSVPPYAYLVERIAGEHVQVEVMIPPGASPATWQPSVAQLSRLSRAVLYVKVGHPRFPFEAAWLDRMLAEAPDLVVVDGAAGSVTTAGDPHVWVAPRHYERTAIQVTEALVAILPEGEAELRSRLAGLRAEIAALDSEIRERLAGKSRRRFLVFHPAWGYFAEAYDLEQVAIEHEHKEPDPRELGELIERAREEGVQVVFVQPQFDARSARTLAREIGARVETLDPLAYDWPANLRRVAAALAETMPQ